MSHEPIKTSIEDMQTSKVTLHAIVLIRKTLAVAIGTLLLPSCSDPVSPPSDDPLFYPVSYGLTARTVVTRTATTIDTTVEATADFHSSDGQRALSVPYVRFNGIDVPKLAGDTLYYWSDAIPAFQMNGQRVRWEVAGAPEIPALTDSAVTPSMPTQLLSPEPGDTLSKSRGFRIRWRPQPSDSATLWYFVQGTGTPTTISMIPAEDDGIADITATRLLEAGVQPGPITIRVVRLKTTDRLTSSRRRVHMQVTSEDIVTAYLAE